MITALSVVLPASTFAKEFDDVWNYRRLMGRVRHICKGSEGNTILRMGHPRLTLRSLYRNWTDGEVYTETVLSTESATHLMQFTQNRMLATESCYETAGYYLNYELIGFEALQALRSAFSDSGISLNCSHIPANDEALELYQKCSKLDVHARYLEETGDSFHFSKDLLDGVMRRTTNRLLDSKIPRSCADIEALDEELYYGLRVAQRNLRKKLKQAGYISRPLIPGWN